MSFKISVCCSLDLRVVIEEFFVAFASECNAKSTLCARFGGKVFFAKKWKKLGIEMGTVVLLILFSFFKLLASDCHDLQKWDFLKVAGYIYLLKSKQIIILHITVLCAASPFSHMSIPHYTERIYCDCNVPLKTEGELHDPAVCCLLELLMYVEVA